jgi:alpha-amylase
MYYREISGNGKDFGLPVGHEYTLAFSRLLYSREILVAYNVSGSPRNDCIIVDAAFHKPGDKLQFQYGDVGAVPVQLAPSGALFVQVNLKPWQFVILE